jgi:uncharacterized protein
VSTGPLVVDIVGLRRRTGSCHELATTIHMEDLEVGDRRVVGGEIDLDLVIEAVTEGVVARGSLGLVTRAPCRRCLADVDTPVTIDVREIFETGPTEGETWPIEDERIDLGPAVREAALLSLPLAPLCAQDCAGPEPDRFPTGPGEVEGEEEEAEQPRDPRWAALDQLELD